MSLSNYPPGLSDSTPGAPWNEPEVPEMDFEITCSQSLSRTATVTTNNYIPVVEDYHDREESFHEEYADTSDTDWSEEYSENGYATPLELIGLLKEYLQKDLDNVDIVAKTTHQNKQFLERKLKGLIEECEAWTDDETEFIQD